MSELFEKRAKIERLRGEAAGLDARAEDLEIEATAMRTKARDLKLTAHELEAELLGGFTQ